MNLKKLLSWPAGRATRQSWAQQPTACDQLRPDADEQVNAAPFSNSNVVFLPAANAGLSGHEPVADSSSFEKTAPEPAKRKGLVDAEELQAFWRDNYFGLGRHNGAQHHSSAAMELGCQAVIAKLQNILTGLLVRRQAKHDALQIKVLEVANSSADMAAKLRLACDHLERDMAELREQSVLAGQGRGWVLAALNDYRLGFDRGMRAALDFELLCE